MSEKTYEFESIGEATLRETWRVTIADDLGDDELLDRLTDELQAGNCEFVEERAEEEREREIRPESIEEAGPEPETAYTVVGLYCDNGQRYATSVYTNDGPQAAEALAQKVCREDNDEADSDRDLIEIAAVIEGEATLADLGADIP